MDGSHRVLVTGAGGQLGQSLLRAAWLDPLDVVSLPRDQLDIMSADQVERIISEGGFAAVVNAAAYTAVDEAEGDRVRAYAVNHLGALNMARACASAGAIMIHLSTDYVFDGAKHDPYSESDPVNPASVYGCSKAAGEEAIRANLDRHIILRTAWLFSAGRNNFVNKILQLALQRNELAIVSDQVGNPTSTDDLAAAIVYMLHGLLLNGAGDDPNVWGTYHCVNADSASWHDLACAAVDRAAPQLGRSPNIRAISTAEYPQLARRPTNSRLNCGKLESAFGIRLRPWRKALAPVVNQIVTELRP